ncbi:hypothetical protein HQ32_04966 [Prauserella sp. Am3]|nr:hypothetical protein HQ32_04966 [Prauserella sp. Am3]
MALAGPLAAAIGAGHTFLAVGAVPILAFFVIIALGRLRADEVANPVVDRAEDLRREVRT